MIRSLSIALSVLGALTVAARPDEPAAKFALVTVTGKVVSFEEAMKSRGVAFDKEPVAKQMVLLAKDGAITPLLSDEASRAFHLDERVRDKPAELVARKYEGLPYLQVVSFKIEDEGRLRTPEYYCEICSISVRYPQDCPCCQGPLIFRMKAEDR